MRRSMVWLGAAGTVLLGAAAPAFAHNACSDYSCCSPHGATRSDTGCEFYHCEAWDMGGGVWTWQRDFYCIPGSQAYNNICHNWWAVLCGHAAANQSHQVDSQQSCCDWDCCS